MQFLKQYWITLKEFFHKTNSEIPKIITPNEPLGRFLLQSNLFKFNSKLNESEISPNAFMPRKDDLKLSVFRTLNLSENAIWDIGIIEIIQRLKISKNLYGRAEVRALKVQETGLSIEADNIPTRHANIVGWPDEKSKRMLLASQLAQNAKLILRQETEKR